MGDDGMEESVEPGQSVDGEQEGGQVAAVDQEFKIHVQASHREVDIVCEKEKKWAGDIPPAGLLSAGTDYVPALVSV